MRRISESFYKLVRSVSPYSPRPANRYTASLHGCSLALAMCDNKTTALRTEARNYGSNKANRTGKKGTEREGEEKMESVRRDRSPRRCLQVSTTFPDPLIHSNPFLPRLAIERINRPEVGEKAPKTGLVFRAPGHCFLENNRRIDRRYNAVAVFDVYIGSLINCFNTYRDVFIYSVCVSSLFDFIFRIKHKSIFF